MKPPPPLCSTCGHPVPEHGGSPASINDTGRPMGWCCHLPGRCYCTSLCKLEARAIPTHLTGDTP